MRTVWFGVPPKMATSSSKLVLAWIRICTIVTCGVLLLSTRTSYATKENVEATVVWNSFYFPKMEWPAPCNNESSNTCAFDLKFCLLCRANRQQSERCKSQFVSPFWHQLKHISESGRLHEHIPNQTIPLHSCEGGYTFKLYLSLRIVKGADPFGGPAVGHDVEFYEFDRKISDYESAAGDGTSALIASNETATIGVWRPTFELSISFRCRNGYFGPYCSCEDHPSRYTCDNRTGDMICREGWYPQPHEAWNCREQTDWADPCSRNCQAAEHALGCNHCGLLDCKWGYELSDNGTACYSSCDPMCENGGVCVGNNTCSCNSLFEGDRCEHSSAAWIWQLIYWALRAPNSNTTTTTINNSTLGITTAVPISSSAAPATTQSPSKSPSTSASSSSSQRTTSTTTTTTTIQAHPNEAAPSKRTRRKRGPSSGMIVGIVIAAAIVVAAMVFLAYRFYGNRRRNALGNRTPTVNAFSIENPLYGVMNRGEDSMIE